MALTETEFRSRCDEALDRLNRALDVVAENYDAEILFQNGVLSIEIEDPNPGKIVISPKPQLARSGSPLNRRVSNWTGPVPPSSSLPLGKV